MKDLSKHLLELAQTGKINQIPKWKFTLYRSLIIILFIMTLLNGALAFGLLFESLWPENSLGGRGQGFTNLALGALPLIWIVFLTLLLGLGYFLFKRFRYGYRFNGGFIIALLLSTSLLGGMGAYKFNLAFKAHRLLMHNVSLYSQAFRGHRINNWVKPQEGRLAGIYIKESPTGFILKDFKDKEWNIKISNTTLLNRAKSFNEIRLMGNICASDFCADNIFPWNGRGKMNQKHQFQNFLK